MDFMGVPQDVARQILNDELTMYQATRFRLTTRLRVLKRVGTDAETVKALEEELVRLELIVAEYDQAVQEATG